MESQMYFDGVGQVNVNDDVVRIQLTEFRSDGNKMEPAVCGRLITTLPGFLGLLATMGRMADKMVETGMLQRRVEDAARKQGGRGGVASGVSRAAGLETMGEGK